MIERAEALVLSHRLSRTRVFSTGSNVTRDSVIVRIEDRDGPVGWGETYLVPGAIDACRAMAAELPGREAEAASADLVRRPGLHRWALGAVTMALDDLRARSRGVAISELYGERLRDRVRPYASSRGYVEGTTPVAAWVEEAAAIHVAGFRAMKLRVGRYDLDVEIPAIEKLVTGAPPMTWMADGNGAYSLDESRLLGDRLHELGFRWLEEPLPTADYLAYAPLAHDLAIPLAGGEILESDDAAAPYLSAGSFDVIQPDVSICGGIAGVLDIALAASGVGRATIPHVCSGAIATAATLQVLAVLDVPAGAPPWAEPLLELDVGENPIRTDLSSTPLEPLDGWLAIPDGPGLGIEIDEAEVRRLTVAA
jgi:D-galactarolactone cycloisomerase